MQTKKIILAVFTFVIIIQLFSAVTSCQNEEWIPIELDDQNCNESLAVSNTIYNVNGVIENKEGISTDQYFIITNEKQGKGEHLYIPCNLPEEFFQNGLQIQFDAEIVIMEDTVSGIQISDDFIGTPIRLLQAKVK